MVVGVYDAAKYANEQSYPHDSDSERNIRNNVLFNHGNSNMKIGEFANTNEIYQKENLNMDKNTILKKNINILQNNNKNIKFEKLEDIIQLIKKYDLDFKEEEYNISRTSGITTVDVTNNCIESEQEIVSFQLKIGEFRTNAGYVAIIKNGIIEEIYDNTTSLKDIQLSKTDFIIDSKVKSKIDIYKKASEYETMMKSRKNGLKNTITDQNVSFYYDVKLNKKYMMIDTRIESQEYKNGKAVGIETSLYEI